MRACLTTQPATAQLLSTGKVASGYADIRNGLLALGNVTKAMHQIREEGHAVMYVTTVIGADKDVFK